MDPRANTCCEISWEVCNKVGGINTVLKSKAERMVQKYGDNYYAIGPYFAEKAFGDFEEKVAPDHLKDAFNQLAEEGIECHFGTWLVKGEPNCILIDFTNFSKHVEGIKSYLWDQYKIDTLGTDWNDVDQSIVWGWAVGKLVEKISQAGQDGPTIAHGHEWLSGSALLYLTAHSNEVPTVFTTHATVLGRTLATEGNLYERLDDIDPDKEAEIRGQGTKAKHQIEKTSAQNADVFTTVSEITGIEAKKILGREPDVLLLNGLDMSKFPTFEEISVRHKKMKGKIFDFLLSYFFPYYSFDLNNTLVYFLAGRYEFKDKGIDIFIKALGKLNDKLKEEGSEKNIIAFLWVPGNIRGVKQNVLENRKYYEDLKESITDEIDEIEHNIIHALASGEDISSENLLNEDIRQEIKKKLLRLKRDGHPPLSTHDLHNEDQDQILQTLWQVGLDNKEDDKVKVIYYPIYLTGADGLLDLSYYESMQGGHLGVFPSYYEPWGYTPMECGALGVPSVTTDLAGFGRYICHECEQSQDPGIWVLQRHMRQDDDVIHQLTENMYYYTKLNRQKRIDNKLAAHSIASKCDWKSFVENYLEAHNQAVEKQQ